MSETRKHWFLEQDEDGIGWLKFDKAESSANTLSYEVMRELNDVLADLEATQPRAVIVYSAKRSGFIAGADIKEFTSLTTPDEAYELIRNGQRVLDDLDLA